MEVYAKMQEVMAAGAGPGEAPASAAGPGQPLEMPPPGAAPIQLPGGSAAAAGEAPDPQAVAASGSVPAMEQYVEGQLGLSPQALMSGLMQRPELAQRIRSPRVQQALAEISASPWKVWGRAGGRAWCSLLAVQQCCSLRGGQAHRPHGAAGSLAAIALCCCRARGRTRRVPAARRSPSTCLTRR
jgi:hypothetical protein